MSTLEDHNYCSIQQAAELTNLSYYFIRQLVLDHKIKSITSGTKHQVNKASLAEYLDKMEQGEKGEEDV